MLQCICRTSLSRAGAVDIVRCEVRRYALPPLTVLRRTPVAILAAGVFAVRKLGALFTCLFWLAAVCAGCQSMRAPSSNNWTSSSPPIGSGARASRASPRALANADTQEHRVVAFHSQGAIPKGDLTWAGETNSLDAVASMSPKFRVCDHGPDCHRAECYVN